MADEEALVNEGLKTIVKMTQEEFEGLKLILKILLEKEVKINA